MPRALPGDVTVSAARDRFTRLVTEAGPRILAYLARRVVPPGDAADLTSEVFVVAWRRIDDLPAATSDATAWLYGIARGVLANHRRGRARRSALVDLLGSQLVADGAGRDTPVPDAVIAVRHALTRLRPPDREVLTLSVWDGLSTDQIALALHTTPTAVRQRLVRARQRLRAELDASDHREDQQLTIH
jgi:RNA polymerase sigma-70 factor (ECF subfamily)